MYLRLIYKTNMIRQIIFFFRRGHAYWRTAPFSEIAELYLSRFLRTFGQNLVDVFVTVYLYQSGYSLLTICLLIGAYFGGRALLSPLLAYVVAWLGPKASLNLSNVTAVPAVLGLSMLGTYGYWALLVYFVFQGISFNLQLIATDVQFSSIKSDHKAGNELGSFYVIEKIAAAAAPASGGFLAFQFSPEKVMWIASAIMVASIVPLLLSPEKIRPRQEVTYSGLPFRRIWLQLLSPAVRAGVYQISNSFWAIFIALVVFSATSSSVYAEVGVFFSISFIASMLASKAVGYIVDRRRGEALLRLGVLAGISINLARPMVSTPLGVGLTNAVNEASVSAYTLPTVRAQYDMADNLPGYRVAYFSLLSTAYCLGASLTALATAGLVWWLGDINGLKAAFVLIALFMPLIAVHGFDSLRRPK